MRKIILSLFCLALVGLLIATAIAPPGLGRARAEKQRKFLTITERPCSENGQEIMASNYG